MPDMLLVFPPQWSPFQPALSLPSLSAWLKRAGYAVSSVDLNIRFYEWLLSDACAELLVDQVARDRPPGDETEAYLTIFRNAADFRADVARLKDDPNDVGGGADGGAEPAHRYVARNYAAVQSLQTYLDAVSAVAADFTVSPYHFELSSGNLRVSDLERFVADPPVILERFLMTAIEETVLPAAPRIVGLSCIGQEQLYFTLLLGRLLKQKLDTPVLVGGTIFSRIFERGALPPGWFDRYFDVIVRNEGEKPAEHVLANLTTGRPLVAGVPGIVYADAGDIVSTPPCPPLAVAEIPVPDFDDLPLGHYLSSAITLPLLSARGCYWGKCEFCHHGMVYGEKYAPYRPASLLETVSTLSRRYGVTHFAFNDEALPPTSARAIAALFPPHSETGWTFTGLIKFERSYRPEDFAGLHRAGFRSLYVGLESASERVLDLMRKRSSRETIVSNLTDATRAGIWMHCFLFFGFPGETEDDARQTYEFILENPDIVSSFGAGTFSLEHNAPIFHHYADLGVRLEPAARDDVDVYYRYEVDRGITPERALRWQEQLAVAATTIPEYSAAKWVPRELLLCMLSRMAPEELRRIGLTMRECGGMPGGTGVREILTEASNTLAPSSRIVVNRMNGRSLVAKGGAVDLLRYCYDHDVELRELERVAPPLFERLAFHLDAPEPGRASAPVPVSTPAG